MTNIFKPSKSYLSMFTKLYKLVFGLDEFTKTKIELRIELAKEVSQRLQVNSIEDFDFLESCIYKIKDQLRVKSSNLNNVIRDKNKDLSKENVEEFLIQLTHLRDSFLNSAFRALKHQGEIITPHSEENDIQTTSKPIEKSNNSISSPDSSLIYKTDTYTLEIKSETSFFVEISFVKEVDYVLLRNLSIVLYDQLQAQGTSIIVEGLRAKIIPRRQNDNVLPPLPQQKNDKIVDEAFLALTYKGDDKHGYATSVSKKPDVSTQYYQEESLDSMISNYDKNAKNYPKHIDEEKEPDTIEVETEKNPITVEKNDTTPNDISPYGKEKEYIIYSDEQIEAKLVTTSGVFGHIVVLPQSKKKIFELNESEFSYLLLFTKIFSSIIFEVAQAHGTTINWQSSGEGIEIFPRFKDDDLIAQWTPKEFSNEELEQIQHTLLQKLSNTNKKEENAQNSQKEKKTEPEKTPTKQKAKFLLDELRKIP